MGSMGVLALAGPLLGLVFSIVSGQTSEPVRERLWDTEDVDTASLLQRAGTWRLTGNLTARQQPAPAQTRQRGSSSGESGPAALEGAGRGRAWSPPSSASRSGNRSRGRTSSWPPQSTAALEGAGSSNDSHSGNWSRGSNSSQRAELVAPRLVQEADERSNESRVRNSGPWPESVVLQQRAAREAQSDRHHREGVRLDRGASTGVRQELYIAPIVAIILIAIACYLAAYNLCGADRHTGGGDLRVPGDGSPASGGRGSPTDRRMWNLRRDPLGTAGLVADQGLGAAEVALGKAAQAAPGQQPDTLPGQPRMQGRSSCR